MRKIVTGSTVFALLLCGCASGPKTPVMEQGTSGSGATENQSLREEIAALKSVVQRLSGDLRQSRERAAEAELLRIESEQQLRELRGRYEELVAAHTESVNEVVRAQAKSRGSVSHADAAANIAEAEIALNAMTSNGGAETAQAAALLRQAEQEFEAQRYGEALFLSGQAKQLVSQIRSNQDTPRPLEPIAGEVAYASPLSLTVNVMSNLRSGPGVSHPVVRTVESGTVVEGHSHSHSGSWVRVRLDDGAEGWIYQTQLATREEATQDEGTIRK